MADVADSIHLIIATSQTFSAAQRDQTIARISRSLQHINEPLKAVREDLNCCLRRQSRDSLAPDQEYLLASKQENRYEFEILINSSVKSFKHSLSNLIHSSAKAKYLVLSTLDTNTNGDLLFQDAAFALEDLLLALNEEKKEEKLTVLLGSRTAEKHWKAALGHHKGLTTALVSDEASTSAEYGSFLNDLRFYLNEAPVDSFMDVSKFTGTLRINRPCLYIFPAKEGDSAYFTINGYSMLINGGYDRLRPCFWRFVNMLQQIDSVLVTHTDADALGGLASFFSKKLASPDIKPNVLTVLGNLVGSSTNRAAHTAASLIAQEVGARSDVDGILEAIEKLQVRLVPLVRTGEGQMVSKLQPGLGSSKYEHINLYSKLGHGSLDLYVLSPFASSKEFRDFVQSQVSNVERQQLGVKSHITYKNLLKTIPLSHLSSAVVLLVWLPSHSTAAVSGNENNALRLLFTGNAPQNVVLTALEKVKDFDVLHSPTYRVKANVSANEHVLHNLVASAKKAASAPPKPAKEPAAATNGASPNTENPKANAPKPVHTTKPAVNKDAANTTVQTTAPKPAAAEKPAAAPKPPVAKPAAPAPAKDAANTSKTSAKSGGQETTAKAPVKSGEEHKEEAKKPKPAAKPAPAPAKPKEAAKVNGAEANGHAKPAQPTNGAAAKPPTPATEKPKPAAKPAPKPAPKEQANTSTAAKKPAAKSGETPAPAAKKEKDEASRIITKRHAPPKKSIDPAAKPEEAAATAAAVPAVEEPVAVVKTEEPAVEANGQHQEEEVVVREEEVIIKEEVSTVEVVLTNSVVPAEPEVSQKPEPEQAAEEEDEQQEVVSVHEVKAEVHEEPLIAQLDALKLEDQAPVEQETAAAEQKESSEVPDFSNGDSANGHYENGSHFESDVSPNGGLIDFEAPVTAADSSFGKGKGVVENLITIEGNGNDEVHHNASAASTDPATWNLLELPKPVIPADSSINNESHEQAPDSANTSLTEKKKSSANGKKSSLAPEPGKDKAPPAKASAQAPAVKANKPAKAANVHPTYVEVTYIPAHGNAFYVDAEYFKRVRARFYILSTQEPSEALLNALIEGKEAWEDKSLQLSLIPTYESESLRSWFVAHEETLARLKIDILPAANLATLTMDDNPELSFQLYKLEF